MNVRFDEDEYRAIAAAATRSDLSPTAYVGTAALAAAQGTEAPGAPIREALVELNGARTALVRVGVSLNKLAAAALSGHEVNAGEVAATGAAARRMADRVQGAAARVARLLA